MGEAAFVAEGIDATISIVGDKLMIQRRGMKSVLQRGLRIYRDPRSLTGAFDGPSKKVLTAALVENKELAKVIAGAVKGAGTGPGGVTAADDAGGVARALTTTTPAGAAPVTKTCPMCAEEIKAAAVLCRFCGHRFHQP